MEIICMLICVGKMLESFVEENIFLQDFLFCGRIVSMVICCGVCVCVCFFVKLGRVMWIGGLFLVMWRCGLGRLLSKRDCGRICGR
jgi:hypothetical protein